MIKFTAGEWIDIPGYEGKYQINHEGRVRRLHKHKAVELNPFHKHSGSSLRQKHLFCKLTDTNGKSTEYKISKLMGMTFFGNIPEGYGVFHKNGLVDDNSIFNLEILDRRTIGERCGIRSSRSKSVVKIDSKGKIVDYYRSARSAGKQNYMCYQTIMDRCNMVVKNGPAPDGYEYAWEDDLNSINAARHRMKKAMEKRAK